MGKLSQFLQSFSFLSKQKYEYFYILDFGHYSLKIALLEVDKKTQESRVVELSEELQVHHSGPVESIKNPEQAIETTRRALEKIKIYSKSKKQKKKLVVGVASEFVYGKTFSFSQKRENSKEKIDFRELKNIVHNAQLKAYEQVRKTLASNSGYSEQEARLVNAKIQEIRVDGYKVAKPVGMDGKEIFIDIFNSYMPQFYEDMFKELADRFKFELHDIVYEPYVLFSALRDNKNEDTEALMVDIGAKSTRVTLVRKGKLEEVKSFSFGGESFTQKIASHLSVSFWEAERIKEKYGKNRLSKDAAESVEKVLQRELEIFLSALETVLKEFSQTSLLPSDIYVYGGGGQLPLIDGIMKKREWKKELSFFHTPQIHRLQSSNFNIECITDNCDKIQFIPVIGLADYINKQLSGKETSIQKALNQIVNLIQSK